MANRIFDVRRQEVTHTTELPIPLLESGVLLGCEITQAQCFICQIEETDNTRNTIQIQVALKIAYMIKTQCQVTHVVKPLVFTTTANLSIPENATVSCVVQNPTCESTQLENNFVVTTVHAFIQLQSTGTEPIVIPFVASCPVGLCPTNLTAGEVQDTNNSSNKNATADNVNNDIKE